MKERLWTILGLVAVAACDSEAPVPDSAPASDTVRMSIAWAVEPGNHSIADSLGDVSGVAQDPSGNVYASDMQAARIWVFDADGRFLLGFGGKGDGPGEFQAPTGPAVGPDGKLYVRDVYRVSVFGPSDSSGLLTNLESTFSGPVYADWTSRRATRFDATGAMLYPGKKLREDGTADPYVLRYENGEQKSDTIFVPRQPTAPQLTAWIRTEPGGGRMLPGLNHVPFAPLPSWDVTNAGTVISGDGRAYRVVETTAADSATVLVERSLARAPVPAEQHQDSVEALRARIDSLEVRRGQVQGVPEEVWAVAVPEVFPAFMALYAGRDGSVWVRRWPPDGSDVTVFDVFAESGEFERTVILDRAILIEPTPILSERQVIGVAKHPLTDESMILSFR